MSIFNKKWASRDIFSNSTQNSADSENLKPGCPSTYWKWMMTELKSFQEPLQIDWTVLLFCYLPFVLCVGWTSFFPRPSKSWCYHWRIIVFWIQFSLKFIFLVSNDQSHPSHPVSFCHQKAYVGFLVVLLDYYSSQLIISLTAYWTKPQRAQSNVACFVFLYMLS